MEKKKEEKQSKKKDKKVEVKEKVKKDIKLNYEAVEDEKIIDKKTYEKEIYKLQIELIKLQEWVKQQKLKIVVIFEGRDAAGKGGVIKTITERLNPRFCRVVALGVPTEKKKHNGIFNVMLRIYPQLAK